MRSALLLVAVIGLCLCAAHAATPTPTAGAQKVVRASVSAETTVPTIAGLSADTTSTPVSRAAAQTSRAATSPTARATTVRPTTTAAATAKATTPAPTPVQTATGVPSVSAASSPAGLVVPLPTGSSVGLAVTPVPVETIDPLLPPVESRTPDIDPGMTPYSGPTEIVTWDPTPTAEVPVTAADATPEEPPVLPYATADAGQASTFELPPGAYVVQQSPTPTETVEPVPTDEPRDAAGASVPRWLGYLFFVLVGVAGAAGLALVGSRLGSPAPVAPVVAAVPVVRVSAPDPAPRLLQPGAPEPTIEQQILLDRVAGFEPQTMHVERLGRNLLRLEHAARVEAQDPTLRLGRLLVLDAVPSAPVPAHAAAWARAHGFRVLAVDGSGMALLMPALPAGGRSALGVLPVGAMVEGTSPVPMSVGLTASELGPRSRRGAPAGAAL